jgi:hypothetical protein
MVLQRTLEAMELMLGEEMERFTATAKRFIAFAVRPRPSGQGYKAWWSNLLNHQTKHPNRLANDTDKCILTA